MTIPYHILIGDKVADEKKAQIEKIIAETFASVDRTFNNYNPESEISQLAQLKSGQTVLLSKELHHLLLLADKVHTLSCKRFDPTVAPLAKLWKDSLQAGHLPDPEKLAQITPSVGWKHIHIDDEGFFWKECSETSIDLGGIAKGYCVDKLVENLNEAGLQNTYVEWGGEIRTTGHHPTGRKWSIGIFGVTTIDLTNSSIATSGNYIQSWTVNGITYTHIIDPTTKEPLKVNEDSISSASVRGSTCAFADALATCLMLFPTSESAMQWAEQIPDIEVWIAKNTQDSGLSLRR